MLIFTKWRKALSERAPIVRKSLKMVNILGATEHCPLYSIQWRALSCAKGLHQKKPHTFKNSSNK